MVYHPHETSHPSSIISYIPTYTTHIDHTGYTTYSPNNGHSSQIIIPSPLSLAVVNLPSQSRRNSPSPVILARPLTTMLAIHSLVAIDTQMYSPKIHYDVSKDPNTAYISTLGVSVPISNEQKNYQVVEGALPNIDLCIVFDHPILTDTFECDSSLTIGELIQLLYAHFHQGLESSEMTNLRGDVNFYPAAVKNQEKRCRAAFDHKKEWSEGMKRIDVLGRKCKFHGVELDATSSTHNYFTIRVVFGK